MSSPSSQSLEQTILNLSCASVCFWPEADIFSPIIQGVSRKKDTEKMTDSEKEKPTLLDRAQIIKTVQTPLGFFVLVVLVVEAILGTVAGFSEPPAQTIAIYGMLGLITSLVLIVSFLAYMRPEALKGERPVRESHIDAIPQIEKTLINKVLCVSTAEYDHLGIEQDALILRNTYKNVLLDRKIDLNGFRRQLSSGSFEIVHFLGFVHPHSGDLRFSENESLAPDGFLKLLGLCGAKLVFLASCDSLFLAAKLAPYENVVAASGTVETESMVVWQGCFYDLLSRGHALSNAYEVAQTTTDVPMVLLMKRDMVMESPDNTAANKEKPSDANKRRG